MPFTKFVDYLNLEKKYSSHTVLAYKKDLESFFNFASEEFGYSKEAIKNVNYSVIRSWIITLVDNGISNRSINRKISSLKSYFKFLLKTKQIEINPLTKHKSLKTDKKVQVPFSEKEIENVLDLLNETRDFVGTRNKLIVELFYSTGIRRAELLNLKTQDVSITGKTIKVLGKRNKERILPLLPSVIETIKIYLDFRESLNFSENSNIFFLTEKGSPIYETLVYRIITGYFKSVSEKVKKSPHILRHSFATHLLNEGASLNAVKELLGHSSLASTQVYTHNSIRQLKDVHRSTHPRSTK